MKDCEQSQTVARCQRAEAIVTRQVRDLFKLLPRLTGFRVGCDLNVSDISAGIQPDCASTRGLYPVVMQWIVELAECHPETVQLMRGRTFARTLN
jgi:hypothetical protein